MATKEVQQTYASSLQMTDLWHNAEWRERLKQSQSIWITACVLISLVLVLMVALNSGFAYREAQAYVERRTGLDLQAGSSRLTLMPFGLEMSDVKLFTQDGSGRQIVSAPTVSVPMQWRSLLTRKLKPTDIMIDTPSISLVVDQNGSTGWSGKGDAIDKAVAKNSAPGEPLHVAVNGGSLKVLDERNGQSFAIAQITADLAFDRTGTFDMTGSAAIAQQFTTIEAHVASLPRLSDDGTPLDLSLKAPSLTASFSGRLSLQGALSLAGTFTAQSSNVAESLQWLGKGKAPAALALPMSASGPIDLTGRSFKSSDINLSVGDMALKGKVGVDATSSVPLVTGQLSTDTLKLALPAQGQPPASDANAKQLAPQPQRIDLSALKAVDADLTVSAFSATLWSTPLGPTTLTAQGKGGRYDISLAEISLFGGTGSGTLQLDASGETPQIGLKFSGTELDFGKLMATTGLGEWLQGKGNLSVDLNGAGTDSEELISTLQGKAHITLPQGDVKGFDVASSIQQAASALINGWVSRSDASTAIANLTADFTLKDGIATTEGSNATLAGVDVAMVGDVDLLRRAIDLRLSPANGSSGVPLAVHVVGPWEKPKLKADVSEALGIPGAEVDSKDVQKAAKKAKKFLKKVIGN